jgi:hypothetical protein
VAKNTLAYAFIRTRVRIRKADSVGVRFLFVYAYSVFSSMIGFIYLSAARFFFTCSVSLCKNFGEPGSMTSAYKMHSTLAYVKNFLYLCAVNDASRTKISDLI